MHASLLCTLLLPLFAVAELVPSNSFAAPFTDYDRQGKFTVPGWIIQGDSEVKQNFVRLTSDRQSKRGTMWAREALGPVTEVSATLNFRISGQGKKLFGDGIGLWLTQYNRQQPGDLHGLDPSFVGIGVIIDTFVNSEHGGKHRDVTILVNDGDGPAKIVTDGDEDPIGCNVKGLRYHEGRDDFSVFNTSRLRMLINNDRLIIEVDADSSNNWTTCATVGNLNSKLPRGFLKKARFGLTGTTGALADNHDVLSLAVHDSHSEGKVYAVQHHEESQNVDELSRLVHDLEHQLTSITEKLSNTLMKLQGQEDKIEERVKALEDALGKSMADKMEKRISNLERQLDRKMQRQVNKASSSFKDELTDLKEMAEGLGDSGGWKLPFMFLVIVVGIAGMAGWRHYRYLIKSHLL